MTPPIRPLHQGKRVNSLANYCATRICDADAALRQSRFLMVVLPTEVSRYANPRSKIGEYLAGLDSAFVSSPDSAARRAIAGRRPLMRERRHHRHVFAAAATHNIKGGTCSWLARSSTFQKQSMRRKSAR